jgi:hypothetical protein
MSRQSLLDAISEEIDRLQKAKDLLGKESRTPIKGRYGRPSGYTFSAGARERISAAQKARWAKYKEQPLSRLVRNLKAAQSPLRNKKRPLLLPVKGRGSGIFAFRLSFSTSLWLHLSRSALPSQLLGLAT